MIQGVKQLIPLGIVAIAIVAGVLVTPVHAVTTDRPQADDSYYVTSGNEVIEDISVADLDKPTPAEQPEASSTQKLVALTFDDGPRATTTERVLAVLKDENVPATFFMIGQNVVRYPNLAKEVVDDGNVVGLHTYDHPANLPWMSEKKRAWELNATADAIASSTGVHTTLLRPPYGIMTPTVRTELENEGYQIVMWNVDPRDWDSLHVTGDDIIKTVLSHEQKRMVILFHDGRPMSGNRDNLIPVLPTIIEKLRADGYTFVTIDKML